MGEALDVDGAGDGPVAAAGRLAASSVDPPDDLHASAAYRHHLVGLLSERVIRQAWKAAGVATGEGVT